MLRTVQNIYINRNNAEQYNTGPKATIYITGQYLKSTGHTVQELLNNNYTDPLNST